MLRDELSAQIKHLNSILFLLLFINQNLIKYNWVLIGLFAQKFIDFLNLLMETSCCLILQLIEGLHPKSIRTLKNTKRSFNLKVSSIVPQNSLQCLRLIFGLRFRNRNKDLNILAKLDILLSKVFPVQTELLSLQELLLFLLGNAQRNTQINMPGLHLKKLIVTTFELLETFGTQKLISDRIHTLKEKIIELQIGFHSFLLNLRLLMILVGLKAKLSVTQKPL